jgi:hypothetical protein
VTRSCGGGDRPIRGRVRTRRRYEPTWGARIPTCREARATRSARRHGVAHVAWTATYARGDGPDVAIDFEVHYLLQERDGELKVFGWVSADEEASLREHGIL